MTAGPLVRLIFVPMSSYGIAYASRAGHATRGTWTTLLEHFANTASTGDTE
jgi:hypothetical protein